MLPLILIRRLAVVKVNTLAASQHNFFNYKYSASILETGL